MHRPMDPQRTPPRATAAAAAEEPSQSTPHSKGTSDHSVFASNHTQEHYAPFLEEDVADEITVTVENFLLWIMGGKRREEGEFHILDHPEFIKLMADYLPRPADETGLYHPFVTLANWCLDQVGIGHMKFCRNDPQYILNSDGCQAKTRCSECVQHRFRHKRTIQRQRGGYHVEDRPTGGSLLLA